MFSCRANDCSFKLFLVTFLTLSYISHDIQVLLGVYFFSSAELSGVKRQRKCDKDLKQQNLTSSA